MAEAIVETQIRRPAPALRTAVAHYVGYRLLGLPPGLHRGLPSRHLTFIVSIGDPIVVVTQTDPRQAPDRYQVVMGGYQDSAAVIAHDGNQEGVAIELTGQGCRMLLGCPASDLWKTSVEAGDVVGRLGVELWERLQHPAGWDARFAICDEILGRLLRPAPPNRPELWEAWRLLESSHGTVAVADVASHVGWSRRHLTKSFDHEFGFSPKVAARVIRFERARRLLQATDRPSIATVAADCGYYDQSHLTRDFVDLAGMAPGEWLAAETGVIEPATAEELVALTAG
jgi:AraC-like DNA-binding protein